MNKTPASQTRSHTWKQLTVLLVLIALMLGACGDSDPEVVGNWQLVSGTQNGADLPLDAANPLTIDFETELFSGHAGCNAFSGAYTLDGSTMDLGAIASTQMACEALDLENMYLAGLSEVDTASSDGDQLTLSGPSTDFVYEVAPTS